MWCSGSGMLLGYTSHYPEVGGLNLGADHPGFATTIRPLLIDLTVIHTTHHTPPQSPLVTPDYSSQVTKEHILEYLEYPVGCLS